MKLTRAMVVFAYFFAVTQAASAQRASSDVRCANDAVSLSADFPGAALGSCAPTDDGFVLTITPEDEPINPSPWYAFKVEGRGEIDIVVDYGSHRHRYRPKVSADGVNWQLHANHEVADNRRQMTITLDLERGKSLWIAAQELVPSKFYDDWLDHLSDRVEKAVRVEVGKSRSGSPIWGLQTNPGAPNVVLLIGRQHPPEVTGAIAMMAFVDELLAAPTAACRFCDFHAETNVVVVPLVNPDGVDAGYWRHNFGGLDLNRDWRGFSQPETRAIRDLIDRLAATSTFRAFFDFHSTYRDVFYTQDHGFATAPRDFAENWLESASAQLGVELENAPRRTTSTGTSKNYMHTRFGIPAITYEVGDTTPRDGIRRAARALASAFVELIHPYNDGVDLLITNGTMIDGTGAPRRITNVGINGDRIVYIGDEDIDALRTVDATGLVITPGFIDPHTHAGPDLSLFDSSLNLAYLHQGVTTVFIGNDGGGGPFAENAAHIDEQRPGTNVGLWRGHNALRREFVGLEDRVATVSELDAMVKALAEDMEAGALGLSSGLFYVPGSYASTAEVIRLATVAAEYGGGYDTHMRDEADYSIGLLGSVAEAIEIGRESGAHTHIAHIKALGPSVRGQSGEVIDLIERAQRDGVSLTADQYPWLASGTRLSNALLPRWVQEGGTAAMLARFDNVELAERIREEMAGNLVRRGGADRLLITGQSPHRGQNLAEAATTLEVDPIEAALEIVRQGDPAVASFMMTDTDVVALMDKEWVMTGSDGSTGHPRKYGTFPRKYQVFVRDRGVLTLEEFVERSAGLTARTFGLCDRGTIATGLKADVAVWDPEAFVSNATYEDPTALADGVEYLLVGGELAIDQGEATGNRAGRVLRKTDCR